MSEPTPQGFIVIADVESLLDVLDAGMLPRLAAIGSDILIPRPLYNVLSSHWTELIDSLSPPIALLGGLGLRQSQEISRMLAAGYLDLNGRHRMDRGEAGVLIVPLRHPWFSPRRLGNLRTLHFDRDLDLEVERHFRDVADDQRGYDDLIKLLSQAPDVPPDPGDEMPE